MKHDNKRRQGKSAFDLIEEAVHLLRTAPAASLAVYFLGAIPFVLGLLFFWADMSRSPLAQQHLAASSLGLAGLFFWMKFCQAIFARRLRAQLAGGKFTPPKFTAAVRIFFTQAMVQSTGLFVLPLALVPALPFAWAYAFYQNTAVLDDDGQAGLGKLLKNSWKLAALWPKQNNLALGIMSIFGFCVFLNWVTACLMLPQIFKMLFGVQSEFTRDPLALLNSTFLAAMCGLTYLCTDPILKAIYVARSFYGESVQSGEDLKAELKPFAVRALKTAAIVSVLLAVFSTPALRADSTNAISAGQNIAPPALDHVINQTIHESKYVWRMPRGQTVEPDADKGVIAKFFDKIGVLLRDWAKSLIEWLEKILRQLFRHRFQSHGDSTSSGYGWIMALQILLYGLVAAVVVALVIFLLRVWNRRRRGPSAVASEPVPTVPDLTDENVRADQLPEDGWIRLARELVERGEFRLAMRAFYLSSLAQLAGRNLISIARFKSNRDYERELDRRAHSFPVLLSLFDENVFAFERVWYGTHAADLDAVNTFASNVEKLRSGG
ncbi:MAG TPA: hypothetical protein VK742_03520 [Candidatus Sulfotelmatobacter sp.]|nr:hypothetical protein [Candidatus Sulfotelmatobacter sp.]